VPREALYCSNTSALPVVAVTASEEKNSRPSLSRHASGTPDGSSMASIPQPVIGNKELLIRRPFNERD